jgi:epoxyqueuosine reductase
MSDKPHLLLHVCCGPCATSVIEQLVDRYHVTAFWHNPNIQPGEERQRRLEQASIVAREFNLDLIVDGDDPGPWVATLVGHEDAPEGSERCERCFEARLRHAAGEAARCGAALVATTLSVSPHKPVEAINRVGRRVAAELGVEFLEADFKQGGGFQRSVELSRKLNLYRQRYCGCRPPLADGPEASLDSGPSGSL